MPLRIQKRTWKNGDGSTTESWRLCVVENLKTQRKYSYPEKSTYLTYGISPSDTFQAAQEKSRIMNRAAEFKRRAALQARVHERIKQEKSRESIYLPHTLYIDFVDFLKGRRAWEQVPPKVESHLLCMRSIVLDVDLDPAKWPTQAGRIYGWFMKKALSVSYLEKVLPLLNEYGYFYCQHFGKPFLSIPNPPPLITEKMNDANAEARNGHTNESLPLRPEHFSKLSHFPAGQTRWLRYSLYFGLRPDEVDGLVPGQERTLPRQMGKRWFIEKDAHGTEVLAVYQAKLVKLPRERRWKRIPCLLPEQTKCLADIRVGAEIKRPYGKYIRKNLGEGYTLYAGRKGFKPLMREHGQKAFNILRWEGKRDFSELDSDLRENELTPKAVSKMMGHQSLTRTDRNYEDPTAVDYDLA